MKRWSSPESPTAAFVPGILAAESKAREKGNAVIDRIHKVFRGQKQQWIQGRPGSTQGLR